MQKIKTLIVDDEQGAHKILENYIERTPELELSGNAFHADAALTFLKNNPVDLIFLDITMPEVNGFEFLKMLDDSPFVIFTTAHSEFALESYEYNAVDYLKKPISYDRFLQAVSKLKIWIEKDVRMEEYRKEIELKIEGNITRLSLSKILFVQSMGNYVKIFTDDKTLVTQITTSDLENNLPKSSFIRVHKSFIVNKQKIVSASDDKILIEDHEVPVGKTFKKYVRELIGERK